MTWRSCGSRRRTRSSLRDRWRSAIRRHGPAGSCWTRRSCPGPAPTRVSQADRMVIGNSAGAATAAPVQGVGLLHLAADEIALRFRHRRARRLRRGRVRGHALGRRARRIHAAIGRGPLDHDALILSETPARRSSCGHPIARSPWPAAPRPAPRPASSARRSTSRRATSAPIRGSSFPRAGSVSRRRRISTSAPIPAST